MAGVTNWVTRDGVGPEDRRCPGHMDREVRGIVVVEIDADIRNRVKAHGACLPPGRSSASRDRRAGSLLSPDRLGQ